MQFKKPKDTEELHWTEHVKEKMKFYNLSESRLKRLLRRPGRIEKGVALKTVAVMQPAGFKKRPGEIWLMYQRKSAKSQAPNSKQKGEKITIISAWRYPGKSPVGELPIPEDIVRELNLQPFTKTKK